MSNVRKTLPLWCSLVLASALAQTPAEQELLRLEGDWYRAFLQSDAATMNRIEGEDMVVITPTITAREFAPLRKNRSFAERTQGQKARMAKVKRTLKGPHVRFIGNDVAVINAIDTTTAPDQKGVEKAESAYYTSLWAKRQGVWQIVNAQWTPMPDSASDRK